MSVSSVHCVLLSTLAKAFASFFFLGLGFLEWWELDVLMTGRAVHIPTSVKSGASVTLGSRHHATNLYIAIWALNSSRGTPLTTRVQERAPACKLSVGWLKNWFFSLTSGLLLWWFLTLQFTHFHFRYDDTDPSSPIRSPKNPTWPTFLPSPPIMTSHQKRNWRCSLWVTHTLWVYGWATHRVTELLVLKMRCSLSVTHSWVAHYELLIHYEYMGEQLIE